MPADFTGTLRRVYTVRLEPSEEPRTEWIPGGESPAKLSLALRDHASLVPAMADYESGAILVLHMRWEEMRAIYSAIRTFAAQMDLPLPTEGEGQALGQSSVGEPQPGQKRPK